MLQFEEFGLRAIGEDVSSCARVVDLKTPRDPVRYGDVERMNPLPQTVRTTDQCQMNVIAHQRVRQELPVGAAHSLPESGQVVASSAVVEKESAIDDAADDVDEGTGDDPTRLPRHASYVGHRARRLRGRKLTSQEPSPLGAARRDAKSLCFTCNREKSRTGTVVGIRRDRVR
jgi:hypothetical protein